MDNENKKELLSLIFDSDIIYQISYNMCVNSLKKSEKQKQEEDIYVIEKNLGEINGFFKELKKQNNFSNYMNLLRHLEYVQMPKYSTVFKHEDTSDKIYLIMKGQVCVLLPDSSYEINRYSMEIKRNAQKKLQSLQNKYKELKGIFEKHDNPNFQIKRVYKNSDDDDDDGEEEEDEESQQPWGQDIPIINLTHPELFCSSILNQNDYFGEIGVEFNAPRSATIVCKTDCEFAILPAKAYHTTINHRFYSEDKLVTRLRNINDMFRTMNKQMITLFASQTKVKICNSNTEIFNIGDKADYIHFIEKGEVEIFQKFQAFDIKLPSEDVEINPTYYESSQNNISELSLCKLKVATLTQGCYFGEDGIIFRRQEGLRVTQAVAKIQCALLKMRKDFFYNNFKAFFESEKLNEKIVQDNLKAIKMKTQENEEYQQFYCSAISKKIKENKYQDKLQKTTSGSYKASSNSRQDTQFSEMLMEEDDILNAKSIKKNLFELYREEKTRNNSITRSTLSPIPKFKRDSSVISPLVVQHRSTLKIENEIYSQFECFVEEYLYPKINQELNPNLFIKKYKKKIGKSGRSISQLTMKSPNLIEYNSGTPTASMNYMQQGNQQHLTLKVQNSIILQSALQSLNKIVHVQPRVSGTRSNQHSPIKVETPINSRAQSALNKIKSNNSIDQQAFKYQIGSNQQNQSNIQDKSEYGIKILQNGCLIQDFQSPLKVNNTSNISNIQRSFQSFGQADENPKSVEKLAIKNSFYYNTAQKLGSHRKSASHGAQYTITRSLKEDDNNQTIDKYNQVNKSRMSQSQLKDSSKQKEKSVVKERYGIDSKYLIKEKLHFLVNTQEQIYQQSTNVFKKPLIKFKSINTIPYQAGKVQINQIKKFSTINAQELIKRNNQSLQQSSSSNLNNSNVKSPLIIKSADMKSNPSVASFFTFMNQNNNNHNTNYLRVHKKLNSSSFQNQQSQL